MLDNVHNDVKFPAGKSDDYIYIAGDIHGHNVVIATIPSEHSHGVAAMASLARDIKAKFPDVLFGLLVGVASGLPDSSRIPPRDIRLGDVLVAEGENGGACILSYGQGAETAELAEVNLVSTRTTARLFGAGIGKMKSTGADQWTSFRRHYQGLLAKEVKNNTTFQDPGQDKDIVSPTSQATNPGTIPRRPVQSRSRLDNELIQMAPLAGPSGRVPNSLPNQRQSRANDERIQVWYGKLGSGDDLKENPRKRHEPKERYDIIGLETGAASVMDVIEKVGVIRGVCDYGNGQNVDWKPYAAATAAAYAKELLYNIDPDTELNRTEAQGSQSDGGSGKNPGEGTAVEVELLPTPRLSLKIPLRRLFA